LKIVICLHAAIALPIGMLSVVQPQGIYDYPKLVPNLIEDDLTPNKVELFAIQCWGAFILGFGILCTFVASFDDVRKQKQFGAIMVFMFTGMTVVHAVEWERLNSLYRLGGIPAFATLGVLYIAAIMLTPITASQQTDRMKTD
jgi:hypothetical protein